MTSQTTGKQKITTHIFPNISRSKGNLAMKFGQLTEYTREIFFLRNHTQNVLEKLILDPLIKKQNISLNQQSKMLYSLFLLYVQVEVYQDTLKLGFSQLALTWYKAFLKHKKGILELVSLPYFLHDFSRKIFLTKNSIN